MSAKIRLLFMSLILILSVGCDPTDTETGSIAVRAIWPSPAEWQVLTPRRLAPRSAVPAQAKTVRVRISATDMAPIKQDFPVEAHRGVISNVPAGTDRLLILQALNSAGDLMADCKKPGLLIEAGKTTQAGDCIFEVAGGARSKAIEPEMIRIEGGSFQMGSPEDEEGRFSNERLHSVTVGDFLIGKYEVTKAEFNSFVEATGYKTDAEKNSGEKEGCWSEKEDRSFDYVVGRNWKNPGFEQTDQAPVVCVSWNDATAYAEWLSDATGKSYRLPTEAEWEYAARAGTTTPYLSGSDPNQLCDWGNVADRDAKKVFDGWAIAECSDGYVYTAPVGRYKANPWGLYDVHGNVFEWTCSKYVSDYDGSEVKCLSKSDASSFRVSRGGGSWSAKPSYLRSAGRIRDTPDVRLSGFGFRLAQDL